MRLGVTFIQMPRVPQMCTEGDLHYEIWKHYQMTGKAHVKLCHGDLLCFAEAAGCDLPQTAILVSVYIIFSI